MIACSAHALERVRRTLERLPPEVLDMLAQAAIERLDAMDGDTDAEEGHEGCCDAGDDDPRSSLPVICGGTDWAAGDADDAEDDDPQGDLHHDGEGEPSEWADIGGDLCRAADSNAPRLA